MIIMKKHHYKIAVIAGDGIGKEVMPEAIRVLEKIAKRYNISFDFDHKDWICERYHQFGSMMPENGLDEIQNHDSILLGAVGFPGVPDHISLWGLLIPIRRKFQQYVNLRPVYLLEGMKCPLAGRSQEILIFGSSGKITKVNIQKLVEECSRELMKNLLFNKAFLHGVVSTELCGMHSSWQKLAIANM